MDNQKLIIRSEHLMVIDQQYRDLFSSEPESLKRDNGIDSPGHLAGVLNTLGEEDRLLNIGFVGRVKAGKSSLLNALFFDGKNILPKAATPMTAALTTLTYGESFSAAVEFFSTEDLQQIRDLASRYKKQLQDRISHHTVELIKRHERDKMPVARAEITRLAERQASIEMKSMTSLAAAHEQIGHMESSTVNALTLGTTKRLTANSPEELVAELRDYVGAGGAYMPFTKIVNLAMPLESLREIRVVDTPGTNDPVVSREERTIALLKSCDVVFVVSPAGQFLNEDDLDLLDRITLKEGVQELVLVASQVDSQLHDSEKRARLDDALSGVCNNLTVQAKRNLGELTGRSPEGASVFAALLASIQNGVMHSASICLTIENELDNPTENWGDEEVTAWDNLVESYPDYFDLNNPDSTKASLAMLNNISRIQDLVTDVRTRKSAITAQKIVALQKRKAAGLEAYRKGLVSLANKQLELVESSDISELKTQRRTLHSRQIRLQHELDLAYQGCLHDYLKELRTELTRYAHSALEASTEKVDSANSTEAKSVILEKSGLANWLARKLWGGGNEHASQTIQKVMTGKVFNIVEKYLYDMEGRLGDASKAARNQLNRQLNKELIPTVERILKEDCNPDLVNRAIVEVVNKLYRKKFALDIALPAELHAKGTLKGSDAEEYIDQAQDFVASLGSRIKKTIRQFLELLEQSLPETISQFFVDALDEQILILDNQVTNAAQTIDRLKGMLRALDEVPH